MSREGICRLLAAAMVLGGASATLEAYERLQAPGTLVGVSVALDGRDAPLYPSPDGSSRLYLEARAGSRYAVSLVNRTAERLGVVLTVDGLNAVSGERDSGAGRMYVLDPWRSVEVQGWRSSLSDVRRFTFVDERRSYAARSGKANEKMGWIEVAVYRERLAYAAEAYSAPKRPVPVESRQDSARDQAPGAPAAEAPTASGTTQALEKGEPERGARARSFPGTGWGERTHDPVVLVSFDPESRPSESVTLRYEYRSALVALGVLPAASSGRGRLWQRDHAEPGFAQPPRW